MTVRTLAVWCPDWSVVAAGYRSTDPVAILEANRVSVCSEAARRAGVEAGQRRRTAQSICPELEIVNSDADRDAQRFEPIVVAIEALCPNVQIVEPGACALVTRGPSRYFGGDDGLIAALSEAVDPVASRLGALCRFGIADGLFATRLAAQHCTIVEPGKTAEFLRPLPIATLERPELTSLLGRFGIRTLGMFADLEADAVAARFGPEGARAHRLARGLDATPIIPRPPEIELSAETAIDPPAERVDIAAFATRRLADEFVERLKSDGHLATLVAIETQSEHGESLSRQWRFEEGCHGSALADRLRWQLDGWLSGTSAQQPTAGISFVRLTATQTASIDGRQFDLWRGPSDADHRATRGIARVQAILGPESVFVARVVEGRDPRERVQLTAWGEEPPKPSSQEAPWPASIPAPAPTIVLTEPAPVTIADDARNEVSVSRRGVLSSTPRWITIDGRTEPVVAVAGPWTNDDRWWDLTVRRRRAFLQLSMEDGSGHLVVRERNRWWLDATYD